MTETTVTKEQIAGELAEAKRDLATAQKAHEAALAAAEHARNDKSIGMEQMVELFDAVKVAAATASRKESVIAIAQRKLDNFDIIAKQGEREAEVKSARDVVEAHVTDAVANHLRAVGVDKLVITLTLVDDGKPVRTIDAKPFGTRLSTSTRSASAGTGRGFRSAGAVNVGGTQYASLNRAYITLRAAKDGVAEADVTPANSKSAEAWLTKNGFAIG